MTEDIIMPEYIRESIISDLLQILNTLKTTQKMEIEGFYITIWGTIEGFPLEINNHQGAFSPNLLIKKIESYFDQLSNEVREKKKLPEGIKIVQSCLIKPLRKSLNTVNDLQGELISINKKIYLEDKYNFITGNELEKMLEYMNTLKRFINNALPLINSNKKENLNKLEKSCSLMIDSTEIIVDNYKILLQIIPPKKYEKLHLGYIDIYRSIFESWKDFVEHYEKLLANPPSDNKYNFSIRLKTVNLALDKLIIELKHLLH